MAVTTDRWNNESYNKWMLQINPEAIGEEGL